MSLEAEPELLNVGMLNDHAEWMVKPAGSGHPPIISMIDELVDKVRCFQTDDDHNLDSVPFPLDLRLAGDFSCRNGLTNAGIQRISIRSFPSSPRR